jgi:hypothetical protein
LTQCGRPTADFVEREISNVKSGAVETVKHVRQVGKSSPRSLIGTATDGLPSQQQEMGGERQGQEKTS